MAMTGATGAAQPEPEKHYFAEGYLEEFNQSPGSSTRCVRDFFQIYPW
jgi:hypothetical protein